ncbi:hypothetical protein C1645_831984 [Glomus cerebriforme]|uniref:Uncharacterized protein n=1 Tax=Glomus cerebriforme TaxID=658196 RepID=A0A397SJ00_9GLOM|nr:hypothetical protein C1645_831984 [Glomus cerebriforme]
MELYFDSLLRLPKRIEWQLPIKKLVSGSSSKIAINDSKGLIAIYTPEKAMLNVFGFDDDQANLNLRYRNISLVQYYNDIVPEITHFLFIKDTEDICFVEDTGRAKIYSLINDSFRPGIANFPPSATKILSTLDGTCIVAFTTEQEKIEDIEMSDVSILDTENEDVSIKKPFDNDATLNSDEKLETNNLLNDIRKEELRKSGSDFVNAHIYFVDTFSQNAKKVIMIPFTKSSIDSFQFSVIDKRQIHLITLNKQEIFQSVAIENNTSSTILGKDTMFNRDFRIGDYLIIGDEKRQVSEIICDNILKIDCPGFEHVKDWTMYATTTPISQIDTPLKVTFVVDAFENSKISHETKFQNYVIKMFEQVRKETKKPFGHFKNFKAACKIFENLILNEEGTEYQFGEWIIQLFCLIPIQIAIARDNEFIPLLDGVFSSEIDQFNFDEGYGLIGSVNKAISFGWYEAIFEQYADLEVKVISSMGEQSCGK